MILPWFPLPFGLKINPARDNVSVVDLMSFHDAFLKTSIQIKTPR